jgi:hypothetical protein
MEVLETKEEAVAKDEQKKQEAEVVKEISKKLHEAQERVDARHADEDGVASEKLSVDVDDHIGSSPALSVVSGNPIGSESAVADKKGGKRIVVVTDDEKSRFMDSVVTGKRYTADVSLMSGKLNVRFRSRSAIESEAIDSFLRDGLLDGTIKNQVVYADVMRFCLLAAGVEMLNGEVFPTLTEAAKSREGLFKTATEDGTKAPGWLWLYDSWRDRTEIVVAMLIEAYFEYEAKYWRMIERAKDENFWTAAESIVR